MKLISDNMIAPIPDLPQEIKDAINNKKFAIFLGAGVSRLVGCKSWEELARNLIEKCYTTKSKGSTCINFKEKETLSRSNDYKKVISICQGILKQKGHEDIFFKELKSSLDTKEELLESYDIYEELYNLLNDPSGFRGLFVTTNADKNLVDRFDSSEILYEPKEFDHRKLSSIKLLHIHGLCPYKDSLVFTVREYIHRYNDKQFVSVLKSVFSEYIVLFMGYGLNEFEILDFLITKLGIEEEGTEKELKHFILLPYYRGEDNILKFDEFYYNTLGINVLGFEKDENGYNQLYNIIKDWNEQMTGAPDLYETYKEIEEVVNDDDTGREEEGITE